MLFIAFIIGVGAGIFALNGLAIAQREELNNYFQGFLQLLENQKINSNELLKISTISNIKIVFILWLLGVTIIGIPFIFAVMAIRGFISGFCSSVIINALGIKGVLLSFFTIVPKEIILIPCFLVLGVNGINFSLNIIKNKSIRSISKENLKSSFLSYCIMTLFFSCIVFFGAFIEAYVTPFLIKIIA